MALRLSPKTPRRILTIFNAYTETNVRHISCSRRSQQEQQEGPPIAKHKSDPWNLKSDPWKSATPEQTKRNPRLNVVQEREPVYVLLDGKKRNFSPILLRDLCQCPHCIDSSTHQKLFATVDIPGDIKVSNVRIEEPNLHLTFQNDVLGPQEEHQATLPLDLLRNLVNTGSPTPDLFKESQTPRSLWDAAAYTEQTHDFDYESYMNDDRTLLKALQQLHTHGLLFVTNVPEDETSVSTVAERIGPLKTTFYGRTWDVRSVPEAKNVAYTSQNLGFHMDLMYMKQPPHLQLLHCIRSSAAGGASLFSDSFKAVDDIFKEDNQSFNILSRVPVPYHYDHVDHYYHQKRPVIEQRSRKFSRVDLKDYKDYQIHKSMAHQKGYQPVPELGIFDFIEHVAWSPPFQGPFMVDNYIPTKNEIQGNDVINRTLNNWHAAGKKFNDLVHRPEVIYERMMKPGECVIFDNRRVLHARRAFEVGDAGKERWLRGAYIDKDPYMSKWKVIAEQSGTTESAVTDLYSKFAAGDEGPMAAAA